MREWIITENMTPIIASAIHNGHRIDPELLPYLALSDEERRREEDPYTDIFTEVTPSRIIVEISRFEVDMNRPREKAVYRTPEDAWGLHLYKKPRPQKLIERALAKYDRFYGEVERYLERIIERYGNFVLLDIHSYNHRRAGPDKPPADPKENPDVNVGTGTLLDYDYWRPLIHAFIETLHAYPWENGHLDVRENVKFRGGYFGKWIHERFKGRGCVLSVEFKKIFMDEWSGKPDMVRIEALKAALASTLPVLEIERERVL
ncbi:MAG: hypothetical protein B6D59_03430 [Campylobacteraceae bacterium 4484_4]|nr:MAG: hypothetical protein B6D59_03430 [Campylobacteraceae bacterium 4484_4]